MSALETVQSQLASVRAAIDQIKGREQAVDASGAKLTRADLVTLYGRERELIGRVPRTRSAAVDVAVRGDTLAATVALNDTVYLFTIDAYALEKQPCRRGTFGMYGANRPRICRKIRMHVTSGCFRFRECQRSFGRPTVRCMSSTSTFRDQIRNGVLSIWARA